MPGVRFRHVPARRDILTAIATLLLAVFALATAVLALMAWRKQSREVSDQAKMLKLQTKELRQLSAVRKREVQERRRAQAVQVYAWWTMGVDSSADGVQVIAYVRNTSQQPVYGVSLNVPPGGAKMRLEALLPGQEHSAPFTYDPR